MAKHQSELRYILKMRSSRLRKSKWNLNITLSEARRNEELVSLADSQLLRWIDELNNAGSTDMIARDIKREIRYLKNDEISSENKSKIKKLYKELDKTLFKKDYFCLIIDSNSDYERACKGFKVNGVEYVRLLGTSGGIKKSTIVFISKHLSAEIKRRIENGRDMSMKFIPAKLEAYMSLTCSASTPVTRPSKILVVHDCETTFRSDVLYLSNSDVSEEPIMELKENELITLNESDGYGLIHPRLAEQWSYDLGLNYNSCGFNTRYSYEKGMVFAFDFIDFAEKVAGKYIVKDAWGDEVDIRNVDLILTTSMLKLWDSYKSCDDYVRCCSENKYTFNVTKVCPDCLDDKRELNYQFVQNYDLTDEEIDELISESVNNFKDILSDDINKTILFVNGINTSYENLISGDSMIKSLACCPELMKDKHIRNRIYNIMKGSIKRAKIGVVDVHGNYSILCGDPYSLCQSIFGMEVTGILKAGEIYNGYWYDYGAEKVACFRAPMTSMSNIRILHINSSDEALYWYKHMQCCTVLNSWDTTTAALNGADKDGDLVFLTDNRVLIDKHVELPALMCVQKKGEKKLVEERDLITANINSFGNDIGFITNKTTSMMEVMSHFDKDSEEYKVLDYRVKCGQLFQQDAIDKAKGIVAKPMPRSWYDIYGVKAIEDEDKRDFYYSILAAKKPYFMRYIYPSLDNEYKTFVKNTNTKCHREFGISIDELKAIDEKDRTEDQNRFIYYYDRNMPVGVGDCVMNRICRKFEDMFDHYYSNGNEEEPFDYRILRRDSVFYTVDEYKAIESLVNKYLTIDKNGRKGKLLDVGELSPYERRKILFSQFRSECNVICSNKTVMCNIILDICYRKETTKWVAWYVCGEEIFDNLLYRNNYKMNVPVRDANGDIYYSGVRFRVDTINVGVDSYGDILKRA